MRRSFLHMGLLLLSGMLAVAAVPTDNPVATFYSGPDGYPAWTDSIRWNQVIDMSAYAKGATDFQKFENARDDLAAKGGGVLYYPAGTYNFTKGPFDGPQGRGLMLKSGVVIRGEAPAGKADAFTGTLELPTKFIFGFQQRNGGMVPRDWNLIGLCPAAGQGVKDVNNVGIAWVDLTGATVYFGPQMGWGPTWGTAGSWKSKEAREGWADHVPDGTHPMDPLMGGSTTFVGVGKGRLVFGCVLRDSAPFNDYRRGAGHTERFTPRVGAYGSRVLVANNVLPPSRKNFLYDGIMFDYGKTCGIDIDKDLLGLARDNGNCPGYFVEGVLVRDNWIYNHGHKGYSVSGKWVTIRRNHNERDVLRQGEDIYGLGANWKLSVDGASMAGGSTDNLSRAFDLAGKDLWIDGNTFNNTGSWPGNDGEGILCQAHGGTQIYSWTITHNTHVQGRGLPGYMGGWDVDLYGCLIAWNTTNGWVGNVKVSHGDMTDCAFVANNARGVVKSGQDALTDTAGIGDCKPPTDVQAAVYQGDGVEITWADASDNEVGFRIDRATEINGRNTKWTPIAYRPRHSAGTPENPQAWVDFCAPSGKPLYYRVVAITDRDNDKGASAPVGPVTLDVKP